MREKHFGDTHVFWQSVLTAALLFFTGSHHIQFCFVTPSL